MEVLIMCGIPGSGKSTFIENLKKNGSKVIICSADHYFIKDGEYIFDPKKLGEAHERCFKNFLWSLENASYEEEFNDNRYDYLIVDNTNLFMEHITPYTMLAKAYNVPFWIVRMKADPTVCAERNVHGVPEEKVFEMATRFDRLRFPRDWKIKEVSQ